MKHAIDHRDYQRIKGIAHGMKSSVAYMGLKEIVYPFLHSIEMEATQNEAIPHFEEDYIQTRILCEKAIVEAQQLLRLPA